MAKCVSVRDFGAKGDNLHDDREAFQLAFDSGAEEVVIPQGIYCISDTLKVHSNTHIRAELGAKIAMKSATRRHQNDFLLTNANVKDGDVNISITGGIWDGCNRLPENAKPDIFEENGYSGAVLNFVNVKGLTLKHMVVANSVTYYVRMAWLENFEIEDISFVSDRAGWNQDGLHFAGNVRHGYVKDIRALSYGQTNDDMIALNADDSLVRVENRDLCRAAIEDITFENIYTEACHCIIRMLSVTAPIRNIRIKNVYGGYRVYAINGDAARYCRTPLFDDADYPDGVGCIENIDIENFQCYPVKEKEAWWEGPSGDPSVGLMFESKIDNFRIRNFSFSQTQGGKDCVALQMRNVPGQRLVADGVTYETNAKSDVVTIVDFKEIEISRK